MMEDQIVIKIQLKCNNTYFFMQKKVNFDFNILVKLALLEKT